MAARKGFTLIELLVVVAIIAILMAILIPSLTRAREQSKVVACLSNVRQFGMAFMMYTNENDSSIPYMNFYHTTTGPTHTAADQNYNWWPNKIATYITVKAWRNEAGGNVEARNGASKAWTCPSLTNEQFNWGGGYGVAENIMRYADDPGAIRKITKINAPANLYMVGDAWYPAPTYTATRYCTVISVYPPAPIRFNGVAYDWALGMQQSSRRHYDDYVPVAFFDGHAESLKYAQVKANYNNMFVPQ